ncbi:Histone-lysine N-methyltransferase [Caligus rogercresseyi]|uniref:Histone-lysine N-methyltransferase n=1 Tax=Caligus rogercresseyi TaxID=217165 RepID=A0A7T8K9I5_CALRO|nr:Histone-lysine N-methyltransferase [Caligus rogercresseyi]
MFRVDDNIVIDATLKGNAARFINHCCDPNCYSKIVDIVGKKHIIIFALRTIVPGEELTYDYKFPIEDVKLPCTCGKKNIPTEIAFTLNVSRPTVYDIKNALPDSDRKPILNCKDVKTAVEAEPTKSMAAHAKDMGVSTNTIGRMDITIWVTENNVAVVLPVPHGIHGPCLLVTEDDDAWQRKRWTAIILGVRREALLQLQGLPPLLKTVGRDGNLRRGAARKEHPCNVVPIVILLAHLKFHIGTFFREKAGAKPSSRSKELRDVEG